jgi:hypothetical protein
MTFSKKVPKMTDSDILRGVPGKNSENDQHFCHTLFYYFVHPDVPD